MNNTFTLYATLSPLACAVVSGVAGAYSLGIEKWLIKSKRLTTSKLGLAYPICSLLAATVLTGLLTFWLVGFTL